MVETPAGNSVAGMKWFLDVYTSRFNRRHKLFGHLFSGRCNAFGSERHVGNNMPISRTAPFTFTVIIAMVAWITLQFLVGCSEKGSRASSDMRQQAETAIRDVGGTDALGKESKFILSNYQAGSDWKTNCPAITKLDSLLNPQRGPDSWVRRDREYLPNLPAHVVIRFGSHAHYEYVWIFDPAHVPFDPADVPPGKSEGVEHLGGAVYLSEKNQ